MPVLVLDGRSRAAIETLQALGRERVEVDVAAEPADCLAFHSRYARRKLRQPPPSSPQAFLDWLGSLDQERGYELIVPCTEASLLGLRAVPTDEPLRRKAILPSNEALDTALDKQKTWELAARLDLRVPESVLIDSAEYIPRAEQFPVVLKPARSKLEVNGELVTLAPAIVRDDATRRRWLERWLPHTAVQQQAYVAGRGLGVELLYDRGRPVWHFVHERIHEFPLTGGASSYRRSVPADPKILADAQKLLDALEWHGVAMVEFKISAGAHWLMEINPRLWGSLALSIDAGVNFPLGLLQLARGERPAPQPDYRCFYYTRDLATDLQWLKANLKANHSDPLLLTQPRWMAFLEYARPLLGRESWDHFDFRDLGITRRILQQTLADQAGTLRRILAARRLHRRLIAHHKSLLRSRAPRERILFLCYGNICRSPLAEHLAKQRFSGLHIESSGLHGRIEERSPAHMVRAARALGVDLSQHRPARVSKRQIEQAQLILVMDLENYQALEKQFPEALDRTTLLGLFARPPVVRIADPLLASEEQARRVAEQIRGSLEGLASWLPGEQPDRSPVSSRSNRT